MSHKKEYAGTDYEFQKAAAKIRDAEKDYALHVFMFNHTVTRDDATNEFWERVADHYGFRIVPKDLGASNAEP